MTESDRHKKKLKAQEQEAKTLEMGQEDEKKAIKVIEEEVKEEQAQEKKVEANILEDLTRKSKFSFVTYKQSLAKLVAGMIQVRGSCELGWKYDVWATEKGVGLSVWSPPDASGKRRHYYKAFAPVNIPKYDLNACDVLVLQFENLIEKLKKEKQELKVASQEAGRIVLLNGKKYDSRRAS